MATTSIVKRAHFCGETATPPVIAVAVVLTLASSAGVAEKKMFTVEILWTAALG